MIKLLVRALDGVQDAKMAVTSAHEIHLLGGARAVAVARICPETIGYGGQHGSPEAGLKSVNAPVTYLYPRPCSQMARRGSPGPAGLGPAPRSIRGLSVSSRYLGPFSAHPDHSQCDG